MAFTHYYLSTYLILDNIEITYQIKNSYKVMEKLNNQTTVHILFFVQSIVR